HTPPISCGLTSYISDSHAREWGDTLLPRATRAALPRWRIVRIPQTPLSTGLSRCCRYTDRHPSRHLWYMITMANLLMTPCVGRGEATSTLGWLLLLRHNLIFDLLIATASGQRRSESCSPRPPYSLVEPGSRSSW